MKTFKVFVTYNNKLIFNAQDALVVKALNLVDAFMEFFGEKGDDVDFAQEMLMQAQADNAIHIDHEVGLLIFNAQVVQYIIVGNA